MALLWGFQRCEEGLDPVAGIEGVVHFPVDSVGGAVVFPDTSMKGAVVVVADFSPDYSSVDSFFAHIVAYGSALDTSVAEAPYYIQLSPGIYFVGVVGLKISLAEILFTPADSLALHPEYFQPIGLYKIPGGLYPITSIRVGEEELVSNIDIDVNYDLELPF
ncbi:hypothetical protein KKC74_12160 [bacterium]|nr:hypothetical protein [bacterium]